MTFLATVAANAAGVSYSPFDALGRGAETAKPCKRPPSCLFTAFQWGSPRPRRETGLCGNLTEE